MMKEEERCLVDILAKANEYLEPLGYRIGSTVRNYEETVGVTFGKRHDHGYYVTIAEFTKLEG